MPKLTRFYKVMTDFKNFIPIDETELEKAIASFIEGVPVIFNAGGATRRIESILPDYHRILGWNAGYTMGPEDWEQVNTDRFCRGAKHLFSETKDHVQMLLAEGKQDQIGKNALLLTEQKHEEERQLRLR